MSTLRRLWVPMLAAVLLAVMMGVPGSGQEVAAVEPRVTTVNIMIPAAAFIPTTDNWDYSNSGLYLTATNSSNFSAPLSFPVPVVSIKRITLYAFDNDASYEVCATLYRARPVDANEDSAATICTVDGAADPATFYTTAIHPRLANTASQGPYLWVNISGPGVRFYGVKVTYTY